MDGLISNVASTVLTSLGSSALQEVAAAWHFKSELDGLTDTITFIRGVLLAREAHPQPHVLDVLIERLKDAVHDADDLIDEFTTLVERGLTMTGGFTEAFRLFFSSENQVSSAFEFSREIKRIRKTLDKIVADRDQFASMLPSNEPSSAVIERDTCSFVRAEEVIGRDDEKQKILDVLVRHGHLDDQGSHTVVLGIYGIGGLGKTTIAQLVFNDEVVQGHFELKIWACIGDFMGNEFGEKFVIKKILSATGSSYSDVESLEQLHRNLREKMEGKKYLLVLDDLWEENPAKLRDLKKLLPFGETGSAVLVTTRSECTAEKIGTIPPMKLQCLSDDASWTLFQKMTGLEQRNDQRLEQIGKEIVKKCANVPLAITVIGTFLRGENETEWRRFKDSDLANIDAASGILPLLKLSYYRLPPHLKHCFTYCSLFPKDYDMDPIQLYYLWIAHGFITYSVYPGLTLEEAAENCLRKLEERCFIQCNYLNGTISTFKMHDLMHDLAKQVAGKEIHIADDNGDQNHMPRGVRHLSFSVFSSVHNLVSSLQGRNHLRTFLRPMSQFQRWEGSDLINDIINSFQCIRVLDLKNSCIKQLPESIDKLIHLRYLDLSKNGLEVLPESITRLHNLETLNLDWCMKLKELPWDLSKLVNLQNLGVCGCIELACMPARMGGLTRLQRLNRFVVGEGKPASTDHASGLNDLIPLTNLRGSLEIDISGKRSMAIRSKATASCLLNKSKLTEIHLKIYATADASQDDGLPECLQPHCDLKIFKLTCYGGMKFPSWMAMDNLAITLPNLVEITLSSCSKCLNLPILSGLPCLKSAGLQRLPCLEYIESQSYEKSPSKSVEFFPSLQKLVLSGLPNVKGWWMPMGDGTDLECDQHVAHPPPPPCFPRLTTLTIAGCPRMTSMPPCPHLEKLVLLDFDLQVHFSDHISDIIDGNCHIFSGIEYPILATLLGLLATSTSTSISSSSSAPNYCPSTHLLRRLEIDSIGYLNHLPKHHLQSITKLHIFRCKDVALSAAHDEEEDQMACRSLERIPKWIEYLTNLKKLEFHSCEKLVELPGWISQLSSLEFLSIKYCYELKSLPDGIRDLTSLRKFVLYVCSYDLRKRCEKPKGDDWDKIQHVPEIFIGP